MNNNIDSSLREIETKITSFYSYLSIKVRKKIKYKKQKQF